MYFTKFIDKHVAQMHSSSFPCSHVGLHVHIYIRMNYFKILSMHARAYINENLKMEKRL